MTTDRRPRSPSAPYNVRKKFAVTAGSQGDFQHVTCLGEALAVARDWLRDNDSVTINHINQPGEK